MPETALEFSKKCLAKARRNLDRAKVRPGVTKEELGALEEKITHFEEIVRLLERERD